MTTVSECRDLADRHGLEIRAESSGKKGHKYSLFRKNELLGTRQSAGALMNLIKTAVPAEQGPGKADDGQTVRNAYQAVLGELDRANAEIGRLRTALQEKDDEISSLKSGTGMGRQGDMFRQHAPQDEKSRVEKTLSEILDRLAGMEKRIGVTAAGQEKRKALNIGGWTIHRDPKGFYRAFRNISGRVHGVYLGRDISDTVLINTKLTNKYQDITGETKAGR